MSQHDLEGKLERRNEELEELKKINEELQIDMDELIEQIEIDIQSTENEDFYANYQSKLKQMVQQSLQLKESLKLQNQLREEAQAELKQSVSELHF